MERPRNAVEHDAKSPLDHAVEGSPGHGERSAWVRRGRRARRLASTLLLLGAVALGGMMVIPGLAGLERYVITGHSMTGSFDRGSVVFERVVPVAELRVGDVITYEPPAGAGPAGLVTHRIVSVARSKSGARVFRTKGDFNRTRDPWRFSLHRPTQARVVFHVPYVGYLLGALGIRWLRMLIIGLPALLIGLAVAAHLWREASEEACAAPEAELT